MILDIARKMLNLQRIIYHSKLQTL